MAKRDYTEIIHLSKINKKLLTIECKKILVKNNEEFSEDDNIPANRILTSVIKNYLGFEYTSLRRQYENGTDTTNK